MLVDDDKPVGRFGDHIGFVNLGAGSTQGMRVGVRHGLGLTLHARYRDTEVVSGSGYCA